VTLAIFFSPLHCKWNRDTNQFLLPLHCQNNRNTYHFF